MNFRVYNKNIVGKHLDNGFNESINKAYNTVIKEQEMKAMLEIWPRLTYYQSHSYWHRVTGWVDSVFMWMPVWYGEQNLLWLCQFRENCFKQN